jgi:hypothetical protein
VGLFVIDKIFILNQKEYFLHPACAALRQRGQLSFFPFLNYLQTSGLIISYIKFISNQRTLSLFAKASWQKISGSR